MTYATLNQLTARYGQTMLRQVTDRATPPTGSIVVEVVDRALADTDAMINGYLAARYRLPLTQTPALLADLAQTIAIYKLHPQSVSAKIKDDYDQAVRTLREISSGVVRLDLEGVEPPASGSNGVRTNDRPRDFTPDNLKGFV